MCIVNRGGWLGAVLFSSYEAGELSQHYDSNKNTVHILIASSIAILSCYLALLKTIVPIAAGIAMAWSVGLSTYASC